MSSDTHKVLIQEDNQHAGEHVRILNAPTTDEVAIVIVGDQFKPRDIVLHNRNDRLTNIPETHRCYDALQYAIMFWDGADGYQFNIRTTDSDVETGSPAYIGIRRLRMD
jgi:hypothetical protein